MYKILQLAFWVAVGLQGSFLYEHLTQEPLSISFLSSWREFFIVSAGQALLSAAIMSTALLRVRHRRHNQAMDDHSADIGLESIDPTVRRAAIAAKISAPATRLIIAWDLLLKTIGPLVLAIAVNVWLLGLVALHIKDQLGVGP